MYVGGTNVMVKDYEEKRKIEKEICKHYSLLNETDDMKQEVFRELAGAVLDSINNWCGNFVPEYNEIIMTISKALIDEIDYISPGEAYYVGDYLMTVIMAAEDMEGAQSKIFDIITGNKLHTEVLEHIAWLINSK